MAKETMKAAVLYKEGEPLKIEQVPVPVASGDEIVLKVAGAGLCHTDLGFLRATSPPGYVDPPRILGHETTGFVESWGENVTGLKKGEPMAIWGTVACGRCRMCRTGKEHLCTLNPPPASQIGFGLDGGFAEYIKVPSVRNLIPLGTVDPYKAAALSDAGLTSYRAVKKAAPYLYGGSSVLVMGIGGLGAYAVTFSKLLTPATVIASSRKQAARDLALELGADHVINGKEDIPSQVKELTGGVGAEVVIDVVGTEATLQAAFDSAAIGGVVIVVGAGWGKLPVGWDPYEKQVITSYWGTYTEHQEVIALAQQGKVPMQCTFFDLEEVNEVFDKMERGELLGRAVLRPNG